MKLLLNVVLVVGLRLGSVEYVNLFSGDSEKIGKCNTNDQMQQ